MSSDLFLGNPVDTWLVAAGVAILSYLILKIVRRLVLHRLKKLAESTETQVDDIASEVLAGTKELFLFIVSLSIGSQFLTFSEWTTSIITVVTLIALFVQAGIWATRGIGFFVGQKLKQRMADDPASATMLTPMVFLSRLVIWAIVLLLALDNLGIDITALVTGLGISGIAVALALQTVLGDLFASLAIVLDKPFVIGDFVVVDNFSGSIEHVGLKTTRIKSLSGEQIVISNSDLLKSRIRNYKKMRERRAVFAIGVTYQTTHDQLTRIPGMIRAVIEGNSGARFDRCHFKEYGESSLNFETVYHVLVADYTAYMDTQQSINLAIFREFEEAGIEFAYPTRTLFVEGSQPPVQKS